MKALSHIEKNYYAILAKTIKSFRKKMDLSQQELSSASGVSQGQLSKIERGEHMPSMDSLNAIAHALNVPTSLITYLAFDRGNHQDEFSRKMFETYDMLLNFWFYAKNLEAKTGDVSLDQEHARNREDISSISKELEELKGQGIKAVSGTFIEDYLSSTSDN